MRCPECDEKIPSDSKACPECGERIKKKKNKPEKNWLALIGYYLGVAALVPYLAFAIGPVAILLGIGGVVYGIQNPKAKSVGHCITAIVLSVVGFIGTAAIMYLVAKDYLDSPMKFFKRS